MFGDPRPALYGLSGGEKNSSAASGRRGKIPSRQLPGCETYRLNPVSVWRAAPSGALPELRKVKQEKLAWLSSNPFYTKRFAFFRGPAVSADPDVAREVHLNWRTVKGLDQRYMRAGSSAEQGDRRRGRLHRRGLDSQRAHLPHRRQRPAAAPAGLVRRAGPLRSETRPSSTSGWEPQKARGCGWR